MATIKEVKEQLATLTDLDDHRWTTFEEDSRTGVQTAIKQRRKAILAEIAEDERLETMLNYEKLLYAQGVELIAGVDEVGRGPLAGPVVAAAVILPKLCKIKGLNDANSLSIAAASIVAKVTRDEMMADYDQEYPGYAFTKNAGYGTKEHLSGLDKLGVTPIHRRSFEPIKSMLKK